MDLKAEAKIEFLVIKPELFLNNEDSERKLEEEIGYHFLAQLQQAIINSSTPDIAEGIDSSRQNKTSIKKQGDFQENHAKIYKCPICSYSKTYHMGVKRHIYVHHPEIDSKLSPRQRLSCKLCDKRFYDPRHLDKHIKSSHGIVYE